MPGIYADDVKNVRNYVTESKEEFDSPSDGSLQSVTALYVQRPGVMRRHREAYKQIVEEVQKTRVEV